MNGQRVTNAVSVIHRSLGLSQNIPQNMAKVETCFTKTDSSAAKTDSTANISSDSVYPEVFNTLNYSDDFSGVQATLERATSSFELLGTLLCELGLSESTEKAVPPCHVLTFLGIQFDTLLLEMRIDPAKC